LARLGVDVWWDDWELGIGQDIWLRIREALARSKRVGIVVSPKFVKSENCQNELRLALDKKRPLIPILYKRAELPAKLQKLKHLNLSTRGTYFSSLAELGGTLHGFGEQRLRSHIRRKPPRSLAEVASMLEVLGWDGYELLEEGDFRKLAKLKGVRVKGNKMEYYPNEVLKLNPSVHRDTRKLIRQ
jgi:hypothetical protein